MTVTLYGATFVSDVFFVHIYFRLFCMVCMVFKLRWWGIDPFCLESCHPCTLLLLLHHRLIWRFLSRKHCFVMYHLALHCVMLHCISPVGCFLTRSQCIAFFHTSFPLILFNESILNCIIAQLYWHTSWIVLNFSLYLQSISKKSKAPVRRS